MQILFEISGSLMAGYTDQANSDIRDHSPDAILNKFKLRDTDG
jgi:hypothetical protein